MCSPKAWVWIDFDDGVFCIAVIKNNTYETIPHEKILILSAAICLAACGGSGSGDGGTATPTATAVEGLDFANFLAESIVGDVEEVECTLTNGAITTCYQFTTTGDPIDHEVGPFCPETIFDGEEAGGKWLENGTLVDITGEYITTLPEVYNDPLWALYDDVSGEVFRVTGENCVAAAQPFPPEEFRFSCIDCSIEDFGGVVEQTYTIPVIPIPRETIEEIGLDVPGVALNGVLLSFDAGIEDILATYNIAALDDCGGHVNNAESYHYHGAAGCTHEIEQPDEHAALIGYAMDGYGIYSMTDVDGTEPSDLDECRGHTDDDRGYHYHATSPSENSFIGCFHGETVFNENAGGPGGGGPDGGPPTDVEPAAVVE